MGHGFDFAYLNQIASNERGDWVVSPLGMQFLLGMLVNGANGVTAEQIYEVMGYGKGEEEEVNLLNQTFIEQLPFLDNRTVFSIANAVFVNNKAEIRTEYKNAVVHYYQAEVENIDFSKSSSINKINGWCDMQTSGKIPKIVDNKPSPDMLAILLNALYFQGEWKDKFPKSATTREAFYLESGKRKNVPMMKLTSEQLMYGSVDAIGSMVQIPFGNGSFVINIIKPDKSINLKKLLELLDETDRCWDTLIEHLTPSEVELWLPRFEIDYNIKVNDVLSKMGMPYAFQSDKADFTNLSRKSGSLDCVRQRVSISIDEEGAKVAVVSSAEMQLGSADPWEKVSFHADSPFLYLIRENRTGAILFAGCYTGK